MPLIPAATVNAMRPNPRLAPNLTTILLLALLATPTANPQSPPVIQIDAARSTGPLPPIWRYFGYDEPNYTYTPNGKKLINELATLDHQTVYIRTHFMLATGNGQASLKFGSTNAYTEDANGRPIYDWTIVDRILDTYLNAGAKPFVEIGFMPQALSSRPDPYQVEWLPGAPNREYSAGWSYPPNDFAKWGNLVEHWVRHEVEKHGAAEVATWYWEVWNEPDISYWHGTPEQYDQLYDSAAAAVKKVLPSARVGGPASTGPASEKAAAFLTQFLNHCATTGAPLDFISYHAKGQPKLENNHAVMGLAKQMRDVENGFRIINGFPKFKNLPIILSESDPEGCAACSARLYPQNAYRNGALYAVYTAAAMNNILNLANADHANIEGMLTWAFEFENQPYFDGLRTLATNGIDKPVLNFFRIAAKMSGDKLALEGENALASGNPQHVSVMLWNYNDDPTKASPQTIQLHITGLANGTAKLVAYRIDETHSNAWTVWKKMGSPQHPTAQQYAALETASKLQALNPPQSVTIRNGLLEHNLDLPGESLTLLEITR